VHRGQRHNDASCLRSPSLSLLPTLLLAVTVTTLALLTSGACACRAVKDDGVPLFCACSTPRPDCTQTQLAPPAPSLVGLALILSRTLPIQRHADLAVIVSESFYPY
jgi:hypothetical protein